MFQISRKVLPGVVVILALLLGAWTTPFQAGSGGSGDSETHPNIPSKVDARTMISNKGNLQLSSFFTKDNNVQQRVMETSAFQFNMNAVTKDNVSSLDKEFIQDSLTSNSLELWTMLYALPKVQDPDLRSLIQMMIAQHTKDQKINIYLAQRLGIDTSVDFTNASVYPETPDYDLGKRTENLKENYLDHLVEKAGVSFDEVVLHILEQEHTSDVQSELAAERLTQNVRIKGLTKHAADVTGLHLNLMDKLSARLSEKFDETPSIDIQQSYQSPFTISIHGRSNGNGSR